MSSQDGTPDYQKGLTFSITFPLHNNPPATGRGLSTVFAGNPQVASSDHFFMVTHRLKKQRQPSPFPGWNVFFLKPVLQRFRRATRGWADTFAPCPRRYPYFRRRCFTHTRRRQRQSPPAPRQLLIWNQDWLIGRQCRELGDQIQATLKTSNHEPRSTKLRFPIHRRAKKIPQNLRPVCNGGRLVMKIPYPPTQQVFLLCQRQRTDSSQIKLTGLAGTLLKVDFRQLPG